MKIVHVVPGSGGTFYCQNCLRDGALVGALRRRGHDVVMAPMYLPLAVDAPEEVRALPVFYGAVGTYLRERVAGLRNLPRRLTRWLDSERLLAWAAARSGSTRARGLEDMTLSMLRGMEGNQAVELERMVRWLGERERPDIVHLSNALLLGLAACLRDRLKVPIVCTLQDEDTWIEGMHPARIPEVWGAMRAAARFCDMFVAVSGYYRDRMQALLNVPKERIRAVYPGVDPDGYRPASQASHPPVLGYLSRLSEELGFGDAVEAFLRLRRVPTLGGLRLHVSGGQTGDDKRFVAAAVRRIRRAGAGGDFHLQQDFSRPHRTEFLGGLTILTVPVRRPEAFGTFQLEAMAAGVPVVLPAIGAFPEIVDKTGGGTVYMPNDVPTLTGTLERMLSNRSLLQAMGRKGRESVKRQFSVDGMAERMAAIYNLLVRGAA